MSDGERCWFCGGGAVQQAALVVGLVRDVHYTPLLIAIWIRSTQIHIRVPRCNRCYKGHSIQRRLIPGVPATVLALAVVIGGMYEEGWLSWPPAHSAARGYLITASIIVSAVAIVLSFIGWIVLQYGWFGMRQRFPRPRRYAREYPAVRELLEDGWGMGAQQNMFKRQSPQI